MKKLIIIGANEFQKRLINKAAEMQIQTHVFAWEKGAVGKESADYFYPISITEKDEILKKVKEIQPDGICSIASDLAMPTISYIAQEMGLVSNTIHCTNITTDKYLMRSVLTKKGLPCPRYYMAKSCFDVDAYELRFPLITKPVDRSGSRGIYKVNGMNELQEAIEKSREMSFAGMVLVEEYVDGREFSVEFISQNKKHYFLQITEKFTTGEPNFIEKGHLSPARLSQDMCDIIKNTVSKALDVLEVDNGASHAEVKINAQGEIKIIEIAARMGGDYIGSDMVVNSTGYDFLKNVINISLGKSIDAIAEYKKRNSFVGFIFNQNDIQKLQSVLSLYPKLCIEMKINENFEVVTDSSTRNGYYILDMEDENIEQVLTLLSME